MARRKRAVSLGGRYSRQDVSTGAELPAQGISAAGKIRIRHGVVREPSDQLLAIAAEGDKTGHILAAINIYSDVLEREYSRGHLTELAYRAGNLYVGVINSCGYGGPRSPSFEPKIDTSDYEELALHKVQLAIRAANLKKEVVQVLGRKAAKILFQILIERWSLTSLAIRKYHIFNKPAQTKFCKTFRGYLETLGQHWEALGWPSMRGF